MARLRIDLGTCVTWLPTTEKAARGIRYRKQRMWPLEIVGAIIDATDVTTDVASIDAAVALGIPVEYISRLDAHNRDDQDPEGPWHQLADSPTLFLYDDGVRYSKTIRVMK